MIPTITDRTTNGTYTSPPGCKYLKVYIVGGGGGGGGGSAGVGGGGGGAGKVILNYYPPGAYTVTIGAGGAGGNFGVNGTAGTSTVFDAITSNMGTGGNNNLGTFAYGGSTTDDTGVVRMGSSGGQAGSFATPGELAGSGGNNIFSTGGRGPLVTGVVSVNGFDGVRGGGGAGGYEATGTGGDGGAGFVLIIEYY